MCRADPVLSHSHHQHARGLQLVAELRRLLRLSSALPVGHRRLVGGRPASVFAPSVVLRRHRARRPGRRRRRLDPLQRVQLAVTVAAEAAAAAGDSPGRCCCVCVPGGDRPVGTVGQM